MENTLGEIFNVQSIKLDLTGDTKETALSELIDLLSVSNPDCDCKELFSTIMEHENKMSMGIGNGVAIPHASCKGIERMKGAIGISKKGIDYNAMDKKPVHVIFLLATNHQSNENYLRNLNLIFRLAASEALGLIRKAKSAEEIHSILSRVKLNTRSY